MEMIETKSGHGRILGQLALLADSFIVPEEALRLVPEPHDRREGGPPSLPPDRRPGRRARTRRLVRDRQPHNSVHPESNRPTQLTRSSNAAF